MAQKTVLIPDIGEVVLVKRRGSKNLRLTIQPDGRIKVGLPYWAPYSAAIHFATTRSDWIAKNLKNAPSAQPKHGSRIGKSYRLQIVNKPTQKRTFSRVAANSVIVTSSLDHSDASLQKSIGKACERALKLDAQNLLSQRLIHISRKNGYKYKELRIKRMVSRWGSCSQEGIITLNYFLIQLPWHLIDYVIVHELTHTNHLNHGREFWSEFESILPDAKKLRKEIKTYRPVLLPSSA